MSITKTKATDSKKLMNNTYNVNSAFWHNAEDVFVNEYGEEENIDYGEQYIELNIAEDDQNNINILEKMLMLYSQIKELEHIPNAEQLFRSQDINTFPAFNSDVIIDNNTIKFAEVLKDERYNIWLPNDQLNNDLKAYLGWLEVYYTDENGQYFICN